MQAKAEGKPSSKEKRGAELTIKPAKHIKKRRCLAEELVRSHCILYLCC